MLSSAIDLIRLVPSAARHGILSVVVSQIKAGAAFRAINNGRACVFWAFTGCQATGDIKSARLRIPMWSRWWNRSFQMQEPYWMDAPWVWPGTRQGGNTTATHSHDRLREGDRLRLPVRVGKTTQPTSDYSCRLTLCQQCQMTCSLNLY